LKGYITHSSENLTKVTNLPMDSAIKEGDVIVTSGLGQIYPKEVRIGEVTSVETDEVKVMKTAIVKPYVDFNKLEELFVVIPKESREVKYDN
ncbi:rod shape-determining protein MreC, partial [Clostridium perfringens]